jgi:hypothetical protein
LSEAHGNPSDDNEGNSLKYINMLRHRERQRRSSRLIQLALQQEGNFQQMDHVQFTDQRGLNVNTYDKDVMEEELLAENQHRFNQAAESPFLNGPIAELVGKFGETTATKIILAHGAPTSLGLNYYTTLLLDSMKYPTNYTPATMDFTYESFVKGWQKVREQTASGKSGLHFGHFIAACKHSQLGRIEWTMANFPLQSGYSPKRWQQGIEVMLLKKPNTYHVSKLRAILLFEADFNHNNKRLGRTLMHHAEDQHWIAIEQYGSRRHMSAIDHCINKRLSFDIIRQQKQPAALCVNDMKGCYDRIVHSVASICMQRMGLDDKGLRSMFHTLQHLHHYVRTIHGVSSKSFQANDIHPIAIQGIGQGNGAGPQIWAAISSVVLNALRQQHAGAEFELPFSRETLRLAGYAYVDDTDIIAYSTNDQDTTPIVEQMQRSVDLWNGLLSATGGQLEATKTFWYNIQFKWKEGRWSYATNTDSPAILTMANADGTRTLLEQVDVNEGRRTLGVRLAPDGNNKAEFEYLKGQCDQWANRIRSGTLPQSYTWQALSTTIVSKLSYALPATTFKKKECEDITRKLISATLSRSGINQHLPRDLVFGSKSRQGLGYPELYTWQGSRGISRFISGGNSRNNITGFLMLASLQTMITETGFLNPFNQMYARMGGLTSPCYLSSVWEFASTYNISITVPELLAKPRLHDDPIMETVCRVLSKQDLFFFNMCRIYLQVMWISDIATADGVYIDWYAQRGCRNPTRISTWKWPNQSPPPMQAWKSWEVGINLLGSKERSGRICLTTKLGKWRASNGTGWVFDSQSDRLMQLHNKQIYSIQPGRPTRGSTKRFIEYRGAHTTFNPTHVVTIIQKDRRIEIELEGIGEHEAEVEKATDNFRDYVQLNPNWKWWSDSLKYTESEIQAISQDIENGKGIIVSDGSYKDGHGTAAARLEGIAPQQGISVVTITPGHPDMQCAYRSEAVGLLMSIQLTNALVEYKQMTKGICIMGCDGQSALNQCFQKSNRGIVDIPHYDVVQAVRNEIRQSKITWIPRYIPGHQAEPFDREASMNNDMDLACKQHWKDTANSQQKWFEDKWSVSIEGNKVVSHLSTTIIRHCISKIIGFWDE